MKRSVNLGNVNGIKISIHWTFLLLILWIIVDNYRQEKSSSELLFTLLFILTVFACVILHELGHAFTAMYFGLRTRSIIILPIGGVAQMDSLPEKPVQELLVALAGPAVNLFIAGILYAIIYWSGLMSQMVGLPLVSGDTLLFSMFTANSMLALFNLIPAFPMDGGRVLRALLSYKLGRDKATRIAAITGEIMAIGFVGIGIFFNPVLVFVGIFVYLGAQAEAHYVHSRTILSACQARDMLISKYVTLSPQQTIDEAAKLLLEVQARDFLVVSEDRVLGILSRNGIIDKLRKKEGASLVAEAMDKNIVAFSLQDRADKVYEELMKNEQSIFPVFEGKRLAGIIDAENLEEFIRIKDAQPIRE